MSKNKGKSKAEPSASMDQEMDIKTIMKDIQFLSSSYMSWNERKKLENKKVVSLGGKPPKMQRLPLSVARVSMKKQKEREEKMLQESSLLGRVIGSSSSSKRSTERSRPEDRMLKSSVGHFKNGVLDVKHLLRPTTSKGTDHHHNNNYTHEPNRGKKRKGKGKNQGKKGKGKKRH